MSQPSFVQLIEIAEPEGTETCFGFGPPHFGRFESVRITLCTTSGETKKVNGVFFIRCPSTVMSAPGGVDVTVNCPG